MRRVHPEFAVLLTISLTWLHAAAAERAISIPVQITHAQNYDPFPSPDGKKLVFISLISGKEQLFTMDVEPFWRDDLSIDEQFKPVGVSSSSRRENRRTSRQIHSFTSRLTLRYPRGVAVHVARPARSIPPCYARTSSTRIADTFVRPVPIFPK
jgi:hypothetical protein